MISMVFSVSVENGMKWDLCRILLLLLCFWDLSSAWSLRSLIDAGSKENPATKNISPLPSPVSSGNQTNITSTDGDKSIKDSPKDQDPKVTNQTVNSTETLVTPSKDNEQINKKGKDDKEKDNPPVSGSGESCPDSIKSCKSGSMVARLLQGLDNGARRTKC